MPNLWDDYTTDEAAAAAGLSNRSVITRRIHAGKQPAHKGPYKPARFRYWISAVELQHAMITWPRYAKKARNKNLAGLTARPADPDACPALPLNSLDKPPAKRHNGQSKKKCGGSKP